MKEFLKSSDIIDFYEKSLSDFIDQLFPKKSMKRNEIIEAAFKWVRDNIQHSFDFNNHTITAKASDVFFHRTGICFGKSHLLAAILRHQNIPCGFAYQIFDRESPEAEKGIHGLNAVFFEEDQQWYFYDSRGHNGEVRIEYQNQKNCLAFPDLPIANETIYSQPLDMVVGKLKKSKNLMELDRALTLTAEELRLFPIKTDPHAPHEVTLKTL